MNKSRLYAILGFACVVAYGWIFYALRNFGSGTFTPCFIKNTTGVACPSCGTTRAILALIEGRFYESVMLNPLGLPAALLLLVIPIWIMVDLISNSDSLIRVFRKAEKLVMIKPVSAVLIALILANWIWNIQKNL